MLLVICLPRVICIRGGIGIVFLRRVTYRVAKRLRSIYVALCDDLPASMGQRENSKGRTGTVGGTMSEKTRENQ